jgi:zinc/manganese transport system substrate-binding protein
MILIIRNGLRMAKFFLILIGLALGIVACDEASDDPGSPVIVATTSIVGDIASAVAGDEAQVEVLIPIGVDAHDFSPSAQQAGLIADADLVVAVGLGLEEGLTDVLTAAEADGVVVLEVGPAIHPTPLHDDQSQPDPHFWMDPLRAGEAARVVAAALTENVPGDWETRADAYAQEMETTDVDVAERLSVVPAEDRQMVTNHESFGYFGDRYEFEILGVIIPGGDTLADPSSAHVAELVAVMEETGSNVIFAETTEPTALAEAIAAELGGEAEVIELYTESLGEPGSEADTLSGMLITNAERIREALT